ncbi:hypothetical protein IRJ41_003794 [Triplophysa rosa]|uniref:UBX domain-containing protein n=1 Tax=Triplophysa rosa TaxID=992332 RepID=A0A9W7TRL4_TRIRA|nr:hypothetical protein IRJ41_003794 [Triplophysa rosa]
MTQSEQDEEYYQSLIADQAKVCMAIDERRLRMASLPELAHGVPLKVKYPSGLMRTRKFILSESIQALFDFVGEVEDATEWFHIQEAFSPPLRNDLCGNIFERNIRGPTTLYVQWISSEETKTIPTPDGNDNHDKDDYDSGTVSLLDQSSTSYEHLTSLSPRSEQERAEQEQEKTVQNTNLQTILSCLSAKIDDSNPTGNQINVIKEAKTVPEAKAAIEIAEDCLSIIGAFRSIGTLKQRDMLVQSAVEYYVDGRCNVALQQWRMFTIDVGECAGVYVGIFSHSTPWLSAAAQNRISP